MRDVLNQDVCYVLVDEVVNNIPDIEVGGKVVV